jgi:hypothetical protein
MPATYLRKPTLGAYQPDDEGKCVICGRRRSGLCSAGCRMQARRVLPPRKRVRRPEPIRPPCDVADLSANTKHLIAVGMALHGRSRWQRPTARDLGVDRKFVWRWSRGQSQPTTEHLERLLAVARQHHDTVAKAYLPALDHVNAYIRAQQAPQSTCHMLPASNEAKRGSGNPVKLSNRSAT